jgi:hypothetical protein
VTPATSVTVNDDIGESDLKTVWFNSRFYRINILWENSTLRIRDIHLFNEKVQSVYETEPTTSNECKFFTLPFVDGFLWSDNQFLAGIRLKVKDDAKETSLTGGDPVITSPRKGTLHIEWPLKSIEGTLIINMNEREIRMVLKSEETADWFLDLTTAEKKELPFRNISRSKAECNFEGFDYSVKASRGNFESSDTGSGFRIFPKKNQIILNLSR